jgi:hypothetical protein
VKARTIVTAIAGLAALLAAAYVYKVQRQPPPTLAEAPAPSLAAPAAAAPVAIAPDRQALAVVEQARAQHFEELKTVAEVFALPSAFARREALYALAGRAQPRELEALIAEAEALTNPADRAAALDVLYLSYVERDPKGALQSVTRLPDSDARRQRLLRIGAALARVAPAAALQEVALEADPGIRNTLQTAIVYSWAAQDAARAFDSVVSMPTGWQREQLLRWTTRELVRQDPQGAAERIAKLKPSDTDTLYQVLAYEWARRDVRSAAQWLAAQPKQRRSGLGYYIAPVYAAQYPAEALEWAQRVDRTRGRYIWSQVLAGIAEQDPDAALQLATSVKSLPQRMNAISTIVGSLAGRDPELAIRYLDKLPSGETRSMLNMQIAWQLAQSDPSAAINWLTSLKDSNARMNGFMQIGQQLASRDADAAAHLLEEIPDDFQGRWVSMVASGYMQYDVDAAIEWMKGNETVRGYAEARREFSTNLAAQDPEAAFEFAVRGTDGPQRDQAISSIVGAVSGQAPEQAARWAEEIADDTLRKSAMAQVASNWSFYDMPAAHRWVMSLDSSALRDTCLSQMVTAAAGRSLDAAEPLLAEIQSLDVRMNAVVTVAMNLAFHDMDAARALLRRYPLDPQHQQQFESMVKQTNRRW